MFFSFSFTDKPSEIDMIFLMAATDPQQFNLQKIIATNMLRAFPVGTRAARVGLMFYGDEIRKLVFPLNKHDNALDVKSNIIGLQNLPENDYINGNTITSSITSSLQVIKGILSDRASGARLGVLKTVILFTPAQAYIPREIFKYLNNIEVVLLRLAPFPITDPPITDEDKGEIITIVDPVTPTDPTDPVVIIVKPTKPEIDGNGTIDIVDIIDVVKEGAHSIILRKVLF